MVAAAILAGGQGRRMGGVAKPLLMVDGQRIIDRQLTVLRSLFEAIVIVTADEVAFCDLGSDIDIIADRVGPGLGPLAGLDAALSWLPPRFGSIVCVAGDMPFLAAPILKRLRDAPAAIAVVPRLANEQEPLCARYDRSAGPLVAAALASGERAMHRFLNDLAGQDVAFIDEAELRTLDPALGTFINVNTPGDLRHGQR